MPPLFPPDYPHRPDAPLLSFGPAFSEEIARSIIKCVWHEDPEQPDDAQVRIAASLTMLEAFHPRDHLECMISAQAVGMHTGGMDCLAMAADPATPPALAIKLRANAVQMSRAFSLNLRDLERLQKKPLPERPREPSPDAEPTRPAGQTGSDTPPPDDETALREDIASRPDGTPGSLAAYAPKPIETVFIPREPAIMTALATRPKPWRVVDAPEENATARGEPASEPAAEPAPPRLDPHEKMFTGDDLARFASTRLDPNAPLENLRFDDEDSVVELELISAGGDPETEARRAEMMAAHPEGKPIVTLRFGNKKPPERPPDNI
jgi:hypothetical protein